jgi:hypothetical protein
VVVDEARRDEPSAQIHDPRVLSHQRTDLGIGSHTDDAVAPYRHALGSRHVLVGRPDLPVQEHDIRVILPMD